MEKSKVINFFRQNWKTKTKKLSITGAENEDKAIRIAIHKAHAPSVLRALYTNGISTKAPREKCAELLYRKINEVLFLKDISEDCFDKWSESVCSEVLSIYIDAGINDYTYGNAQKLVNMTMKYILSANKIDYDLKIFEVCHIPIDRVIMNKAKKKLGVKPLPQAWSKTKKWEDIIAYQKRIRSKVAQTENKYPLFWEITNWGN